MQRDCLLINRHPFCLIAHPHSKAQFGKGGTPVAWHLCLFNIKPTSAKGLTVTYFVAPKVCMIWECGLRGKSIHLCKIYILFYRAGCHVIENEKKKILSLLFVILLNPDATVVTIVVPHLFLSFVYLFGFLRYFLLGFTKRTKNVS